MKTIFILFVIGILLFLFPYFETVVSTASPKTVWTVFLIVSLLLSWYSIDGIRKKRIVYISRALSLHILTGEEAVAFGALYLTLGLGTIFLALLELFRYLGW